ncbi:MAG: hypothetical protein JJU27_18095 [Gammaproteobacteria bacterium]|nr:hypothetical protein [Gammaproteobacteria bacterium]
MMSDAGATTTLMFTLPFDRDAWIAKARDAALAYRNRGLPEMLRTQMPALRRTVPLRAVN